MTETEIEKALEEAFTWVISEGYTAESSLDVDGILELDCPIQGAEVTVANRELSIYIDGEEEPYTYDANCYNGLDWLWTAI